MILRQSILPLLLAMAATATQAQVELRLSRNSLEACETLVAQAAHADGRPRVWRWSIQEAGRGEFTRTRTGPANLFRAPRVHHLEVVHLQVEVEGDPASRVVAAVNVLPSSLEIRAAGGKTSLRSGERLRFVAIPRDGRPRRLQWSLLGSAGGNFLRTDLKGVVDYVAPFTLAKTKVHICALDPATGQTGLFPLTLLPSGPPGAMRAVLEGGFLASALGELRGPSPYVLAPVLRVEPQRQPGFIDNLASRNYDHSPLLGIHYLDDPALGSLHGHWLINDYQGLQVLSPSGAVRRIPLRRKADAQPGLPALVEPMPATACEAVAVRPAGSAPANPRRVVVALRTGGSHSRLYELDAEENLRELTVRPHADYLPGATDPHNAVGALMAMEEADRWNYTVDAMAMDRDGRLFLARGGTWIEQISPAGVRTWIAGLPDGLKFRSWLREHDIDLARRDSGLALDGWGAEAGFRGIRGLAWDEERHRLYVSDGEAIRSVHPGTGEVVTLLGSLAPEARGFAPAPLPVAGLAPGQPCLSFPSHLALDKGVLFVADTGNHAVRAFNLQQRLLYTLVGDRTQGEFRSGPLGCVEPDLLPGECAALDQPIALALAPRGEGPTRVMVIDQTGVATFGLPPDHAVAPRRRAPAAEERKERKESKEPREGKEEKRG